MATISKTVASQPISVCSDRSPTAVSVDKLLQLDPKLQRARELMQKGDYQQALSALPNDNRNIEVRNTCAVCFMRMHRFKEAMDVLRTVALNSAINVVRNDVPDHVRINFAIALFYGGQPAGGLEALQEIRRESDPCVIMLREQARQWVASMGFFRRLDWRMNRVAPKTMPVPPAEPLGRCIWDVV